MNPGSGGGGIEFADEPPLAAKGAAPWKVLIADDDRSVHDVIRLALTGVRFEGRELQFLDAYDGQGACRIVRDDDGIALVLLDLGMEGDRSGLEAARLIRLTIGDRRVRIVLSTGDIEPAMRAGTMEQLDISECWQKSDLTAQRLRAIVGAAITRFAALAAAQRGNSRPATVTLRCLPGERPD